MFDLAQSTIAKWFLWAFLDGVALGVFHDIIRAFKMLCGISYFGEKKKKGIFGKAFEHFLTFLCDIVFFLVASVVSLLLIYRMGGGIFRAFTYGSMAIGFILYYFTVGKLTLRLTDIIIGFLKKILKKIAFLLLLPVKKIFLALICLYRLTIGKIIGKIIEEKKRRDEERLLSLQEEKLPDESAGGEEEYVYVGEKRCYRKSGRIDFGCPRGKGADT